MILKLSDGTLHTLDAILRQTVFMGAIRLVDGITQKGRLSPESLSLTENIYICTKPQHHMHHRH